LRHILVFFYAVTGVMTFQDFQNQTKKNINPTRINRLGATVGNERLKKSVDLWLLSAHVLYIKPKRAEGKGLSFNQDVKET
jgi:hypothetical protein